MSAPDILNQGIKQLGLEIAESNQVRMLAYLEMLQKWNKAYNLTAIRQSEQMVSHHLLDSLSVLPHLWQGRWLDVGCGAGLPGLVLAIARPEWQFTLLDSNSKKTSFVQQAIIDLNIPNVEIFCTRVEEWNSREKFDGIISRAFADLDKFISATRHLLAENGVWVAMRGRQDRESGLTLSDARIVKMISLQVPGLDAERHLAILKMDQN